MSNAVQPIDDETKRLYAMSMDKLMAGARVIYKSNRKARTEFRRMMKKPAGTMRWWRTVR